MKRIYLIDSPGIVPPSKNDTPEDILLRGVVRVENVENPAQYLPAVLKRVQPKHIERTYGIKVEDGDAIEFLSVLAKKGGRLLKGGEPDLDGVAKMVLNDFLRGKIPWFTPPPRAEGEAEQGSKDGIEGRVGRLGEMGKKRKIGEEVDVASTKDPLVPSRGAGVDEKEGDAEEDESSFEGLDDDEVDDDDADDGNGEEEGSEGGVDLDDISGAEDSE